MVFSTLESLYPSSAKIPSACIPLFMSRDQVSHSCRIMCKSYSFIYIYLRHLHYLPTHSDHQHRPADVSYLTPVPTVCSRYNDSTTGEVTVYVPTESRIVPPSRPGPSSLLYSGFQGRFPMGSEADDSHITSTRVEKMWICTYRLFTRIATLGVGLTVVLWKGNSYWAVQRVKVGGT